MKRTTGGICFLYVEGSDSPGKGFGGKAAWEQELCGIVPMFDRGNLQHFGLFVKNWWFFSGDVDKTNAV